MFSYIKHAREQCARAALIAAARRAPALRGGAARRGRGGRGRRRGRAGRRRRCLDRGNNLWQRGADRR